MEQQKKDAVVLYMKKETKKKFQFPKNDFLLLLLSPLPLLAARTLKVVIVRDQGASPQSHSNRTEQHPPERERETEVIYGAYPNNWRWLPPHYSFKRFLGRRVFLVGKSIFSRNFHSSLQMAHDGELKLIRHVKDCNGMAWIYFLFFFRAPTRHLSRDSFSIHFPRSSPSPPAFPRCRVLVVGCCILEKAPSPPFLCEEEDVICV